MNSTIVLLCHGLYSTPNELLTINSALVRQGVATKHLIVPGYSFDTDATRFKPEPKFEAWLDFIEAEIHKLKESYNRIVLLGVSAGANLALGVAAQNKGVVDGLVLLSTPLFMDGWNIPFYSFLLPIALYTPLGRLWRYSESPPYGVKNERMRDWIESELKTRRISSAGAAIIEIPYLREHDRLQRFIKRQLPNVFLPQGLAIHAKEDEIGSLKNLEFLRTCWESSVSKSKSTLETITLLNSYHMITLDNDRQQVCADVIRFINSHFGKPSQ